MTIAAQVNFLNSDLGGKNSPFGKGLSPKLIFNDSENEFFTELNISDTKIIFPGEQIKLELTIKSDPNILIHKGASFNLFEGEKNIGNGTIMEIQ
jgi:translation elongation factor EF-Tu-like GTPase